MKSNQLRINSDPPDEPEVNLLPLDKHCWNLGRIMLDQDVVGDAWTRMQGAAEWLQVSSGIMAVQFSAGRHDPSLYLCEPAVDYHDGKDKTLEEMVLQLSRFALVWGALETYLEDHDYESWTCPKEVGGGKIRRACWFLKQRYEPRQLISPYRRELRLFLHDVICIGKRALRPEYSDILGRSGLGLAIVYKIRNEFAHGSLRMPEPDDNHKPQYFESTVIERATRLVLLSLQMLVSAQFDDKELQQQVEYWSESDSDDQNPSLGSVLETLHTMPSNDDPKP